MSPLTLAMLWLGAGLAAGFAAGRVRRARLAAVGPLAAGGLCTLASSTGAWPGPAAHSSFGAALVLGRPGLGLLAAAGLAIAATMVLAPGLLGGEAPLVALAGAAAVVMLSATVPVVWALAGAVAVGAVAVRWVEIAPDRGTLAAGRIGGLGAAALLAAAALAPADTGLVDSRTALAGGLLAAGVAALVGLVPLGGWVVAGVRAVRGADLAVWGLLVAPATLLSVGAALPALPAAASSDLTRILVVLGLVSAVFGGVQACRVEPSLRYGRLLVADLAMAAAGLGSLHDAGRLGGLLIVLTHLVAGPLLLHAPRPGLERPRRVAWLTLAGLPPAAAFWGRLLVLEGLAETSTAALAAGLVGTAALTASAVRCLVAADPAGEGRPAGSGVRALGGALCLGGVGVGLAPAAIAERVFGVSFV